MLFRSACATARAELPKGKFKWTLLFWVTTSIIVSAAIYLIGSWWWTAFIWLAVLAAAVTGIVIWNKKHPWKAKERVTVAEGAKEAADEAAFTEDKESDKKE